MKLRRAYPTRPPTAPLAALEPVLIAQPLKNTFGRVPLLAVPGEVFQQPLVDEASKAIQLRPFDLSPAPIARRNRKTRDLLHARPRNPKMQSRRTLAHALATRKAHLPAKVHAENTPALLSPERAKVAKSYPARSRTIPPLPWQTFALPFSGLELHLPHFSLLDPIGKALERDLLTGMFEPAVRKPDPMAPRPALSVETDADPEQEHLDMGPRVANVFRRNIAGADRDQRLVDIHSNVGIRVRQDDPFSSC